MRDWRGLEAKAAEGRERFLAGMWEELPRERAEVVIPSAGAVTEEEKMI